MWSLASRLEALKRRVFQPDDVTGFRLVVTATGDPAVDGAVANEADAAGVWVNSADDPAHCSFILPAVHHDGAVTIAVSTGGLILALAAWLRSRLARPAGADSTRWPTAARDATTTAPAGRRSDSLDWAARLDGELPSLVRAGDLDSARVISRPRDLHLERRVLVPSAARACGQYSPANRTSRTAHRPRVVRRTSTTRRPSSSGSGEGGHLLGIRVGRSSTRCRAARARGRRRPPAP